MDRSEPSLIASSPQWTLGSHTGRLSFARLCVPCAPAVIALSSGPMWDQAANLFDLFTNASFPASPISSSFLQVQAHFKRRAGIAILRAPVQSSIRFALLPCFILWDSRALSSGTRPSHFNCRQVLRAPLRNSLGRGSFRRRPQNNTSSQKTLCDFRMSESITENFRPRCYTGRRPNFSVPHDGVLPGTFGGSNVQYCRTNEHGY